MDGIELNLARLAEAGTTLSRVKTEFESASARSAGLATAVGHASLGRALDAFSDKWDDTREDMVANIGVLGEISERGGAWSVSRRLSPHGVPTSSG